MQMAFIQYVSLGPVTLWKAVPPFKGNVCVLWCTTGVDGIGVGQCASLGPITMWKAVLWFTLGIHGNGI